jgi:hypothetical protein
MARGRAVYALGAIRLVNGVLALAVPRKLVRMFGVDPDRNGTAVYALRLFGIRTIVLGVQLLTSKGEPLEEAIKFSPVIHASDTTAAVVAGLRGDLPGRASLIATAISTINTGLALLARRSLSQRRAASPSRSGGDVK